MAIVDLHASQRLLSKRGDIQSLRSLFVLRVTGNGSDIEVCVVYVVRRWPVGRHRARSVNARATIPALLALDGVANRRRLVTKNYDYCASHFATIG